MSDPVDENFFIRLISDIRRFKVAPARAKEQADELEALNTRIAPVFGWTYAGAPTSASALFWTGKHGECFVLPRFTTSYDAAMLLVPPTKSWAITTIAGSNRSFAIVGDHSAHANTGPLALCVAGLTARHEIFVARGELATATVGDK